MKKVILAGIFLLLLYASFWIVYWIKLSSANEQFYQSIYVNREINSTLYGIHEYSIDPYRIALIIEDTIEHNDLTYGVICMDTNFKDYIAVGDSVYKQAGSEILFFCKEKSDCRGFKLNFCKL